MSIINFKKIKGHEKDIIKYILVSYSTLFIIGLIFFILNYHSLSVNLIFVSIILLSPVFILFTFFIYWGYRFWRKKNWLGYITILFLPYLILLTMSMIYYSIMGLSFSCELNPFERIPEIFHTYSLDITDSFLRNEKEMQYLLTYERLVGSLNAPGDYQIYRNSCQRQVRFKWNNKSSAAVIIEGLSNQARIEIQPGKSYTGILKEDKDYPYLLNNYSKIIHVNSEFLSNSSLSSELKNFCFKQVKGRALVVFSSEINNDERDSLFQSIGLILIDEKPYYSYLTQLTGEKSLEEIMASLKNYPQLSRLEMDCSLKLDSANKNR